VSLYSEHTVAVAKSSVSLVYFDGMPPCSSYAFINYRRMSYNNKHSTVAKSESNDISRLNQTAGCYNTLNRSGPRTPPKWPEISTFLNENLKLCDDRRLTSERDHKNNLTKYKYNLQGSKDG
jgi:hypothetical protein